MRTVTPHRADAISIQDLEEAVCQPVPILMEENEVVQYLVENVNAGHAGSPVCSCYETVKVYRVTWVFRCIDATGVFGY